MKITVYFNFKDVKPMVVQNATVVAVDVLRASSTIATFFYHGATGVHLCPESGTAKRMFDKLKRGEGLLAGERDWKKIPGFHLSGSPLGSSREKVKDRIVCFSTPSPLRPLKNAKVVLLGAFVNLGEIYDACLRNAQDVVIACAGGKEDAVFAGMLVDYLQSTLGSEPVVLTESAKDAVGRYRPWQGKLQDLLRQCEEGLELARAGFEKDLDFCSKTNKASVLPYWKDDLIVKDNTPRPKRNLLVDGKSKSGSSVSKGKSIKVTVPLFPKNPEHPVPGMEKDHGKGAASKPQDKKKPANGDKAPVPPSAAKKPEPKGAAPSKAKETPSIPMFSKPAAAKPGAPKKPEPPKKKK